MDRIKKLLSRPGYRYLIIGGSVYALELVVITLSQSLGASAILAVGLSFWIGLIVSFLLQKLITFSDKRTHHKVLVPQIIAFSLLVLFNFGLTPFRRQPPVHWRYS
jgi:putative flippase GtrA